MVLSFITLNTVTLDHCLASFAQKGRHSRQQNFNCGNHYWFWHVRDLDLYCWQHERNWEDVQMHSHVVQRTAFHPKFWFLCLLRLKTGQCRRVSQQNQTVDWLRMRVSPFPNQENLHQSELYQLDENDTGTCGAGNQKTKTVAEQRDGVQQKSGSDSEDLQQGNEILRGKDMFYTGVHNWADGCCKTEVIRGSKLSNRVWDKFKVHGSDIVCFGWKLVRNKVRQVRPDSDPRDCLDSLRCEPYSVL